MVLNLKNELSRTTNSSNQEISELQNKLMVCDIA